MRRTRGVNRNIQRFASCKVWGQGTDPSGAFRQFVKNDVIKNIDMHRDTVKRVDDFEQRREAPAIGCTKTMRSTGFKDGTKPAMGQSQSANRLPAPPRPQTDNIIAFSSTANNRPFQNVVNTIIKQPKFTKSSQSTNSWAPDVHKISMGNCVSVGYDPITFQDREHAVVRKNVKIDVRRAKGIAEFSDLMRPSNPNPNAEFREAFSEDPKVFARKTGIFTHMYEAAARHGYMTMPFDKTQDLGGKPAFKC